MLRGRARRGAVAVWLTLAAAATHAQTVALATDATNAPPALPAIAVIIDDVGYRLAEGQRVVRLPGPVAVSVLPHTAHGAALAREADAAGKEVLLHLPMQAIAADEEPGPGALELDQTRSEFAAVFAADLASVPLVRGVNNHMGSLLTRHPGHMRWLMEELKARPPLYFIDSYTSAQSVGLMIAVEEGVPAMRRDVFLDAEDDPVAIEAEWRRLIDLARERGRAIAIGHPYPATLAMLERLLPALPETGVRLVPLAELLAAPAAAVR
jgi:polysaccharide deacetylase 2 family uncharacterized protein YibQ